MGIQIEAAAYNIIGRRKNNEDNFYLNGVLRGYFFSECRSHRKDGKKKTASGNKFLLGSAGFE